MTYISSAELRRRADVQDHYENGGMVQCKPNGHDVWVDIKPIEWRWDRCDYRPYVEPPKPREWWIWRRANGGDENYHYIDRAECEFNHRHDTGRAVLMREVVE